MFETIKSRIGEMDDFLKLNEYSSYDPYDGLASPLADLLVSRNQLLSRIWQQAVRLFPFNIRPLIGVKKMVHTKAISDFASAYCLLYKSSQRSSDKLKAIYCLDLLKSISSRTTNGLGWGLRFPFATRFVKADASQANIFQTINAIHSFLDGYEFLHDRNYLSIAEQGFHYLIDDLGFVETETTIFWRYWKNLPVEIYNISGLMIGLCARMGSLAKSEKHFQYAKKLFNYIKAAQNADGSWHYSADPKGKFIDGFHTGYILEGIIKGMLYGAIEKDPATVKGVEYYLGNFFTEDGTPRYYYNSTYPIDGQNAAQSLQTLHFILNANFAPKELLEKAFRRVDSLLWNKKGYYNYKKTKLMDYKTPMHRWVTGPMFLALAYIKANAQ